VDCTKLSTDWTRSTFTVYKAEAKVNKDNIIIQSITWITHSYCIYESNKMNGQIMWGCLWQKNPSVIIAIRRNLAASTAPAKNTKILSYASRTVMGRVQFSSTRSRFCHWIGLSLFISPKFGSNRQALENVHYNNYCNAGRLTCTISPAHGISGAKFTTRNTTATSLQNDCERINIKIYALQWFCENA